VYHFIIIVLIFTEVLFFIVTIKIITILESLKLSLLSTAMQDEINENAVFKPMFGRLSGWLTEIYVARGWVKRTSKQGMYYITQLGKKFLLIGTNKKKPD
jgi:hypothetical protein